MMPRRHAVPITGEPVVIWADAMITREPAGRCFVLWETTDYRQGVALKRMDDLERLKAYANRRARLEWASERIAPPDAAHKDRGR